MGAEVHLGVTEEGADDERLEELALLLRQELLELDVDSVEPLRGGEAPEGTRSGLIALAGALTLSLQPTVQVVGGVIALVRDWLRRSGSQRSVRLEVDGDVLEVTGVTSEVQQRLIDDWINRHAETG
ncbi:MAG TPA: hypothetical protein VFT31_07740 [Kribbella sp.]|nr:hypothetical protein [Kribbella sp.]